MNSWSQKKMAYTPTELIKKCRQFLGGLKKISELSTIKLN